MIRELEQIRSIRVSLGSQKHEKKNIFWQEKVRSLKLHARSWLNRVSGTEGKIDLTLPYIDLRRAVDLSKESMIDYGTP